MSHLLNVRQLSVRFRQGGFLRGATVRAVTDVSMMVHQGEVLGLVGESGCGKSTLGHALLRLGEPARATAQGSVIEFEGRNLVGLAKRELLPLRERLQIVQQNPYSSLDPRMPAGDIIAEPLRNFRHPRIRDRVREVMTDVGLDPSMDRRFPHEFSGGQRQRIAIARALATKPEFVVADEPISALDVSIQAQILNLLKELQGRLGLTLLFVSHDLRAVRYIATRIAVMYLGRIVEIGSAEQVVMAPQHPYTKALISAVPQADPDATRDPIRLEGDLPSPVSPPSGCAFRTRCPVAVSTCERQVPQLRRIGQRLVACGQLVPDSPE